ncbi:hypothetical protein A8M49_16685 [Escherichia coli]|nr:hypothetical protein A8M49_16685 [Escherichia coli]
MSKAMQDSVLHIYFFVFLMLNSEQTLQQCLDAFHLILYILFISPSQLSFITFQKNHIKQRKKHTKKRSLTKKV